jgi:hypothetical protein
MAKKKRLTAREIVELYHPGANERHERVQRRLLAMLEELKRREAERRASGTANS